MTDTETIVNEIEAVIRMPIEIAARIKHAAVEHGIGDDAADDIAVLVTEHLLKLVFPAGNA